MTNQESLEVLRTSTNDFAESLLAQYDERGDLSEKQWYWINKLAQEHAARGAFLPIYELLAKASEHLKYPKLVLNIDGHDLKLYRSGPKSKHCGAVQITDGGAFGDNVWYGRIEESGNLIASRDCVDTVRAALISLAGDVVGVTAAYGIATGNCCFCNARLTDERSLEAGFGPTCANHFGLPWGSK